MKVMARYFSFFLFISYRLSCCFNRYH